MRNPRTLGLNDCFRIIPLQMSEGWKPVGARRLLVRGPRHEACKNFIPIRRDRLFMMATWSPIANKAGLYLLAMPPNGPRSLIAQMPLIGAKSLRIQNRDRSDDGRENWGDRPSLKPA